LGELIVAAKKYIRPLAALLPALAIGLCFIAGSLQGAGVEPGGTTEDVTGTITPLYYSSRDNALTVKLDLEIEEPLSETGYELDVECRVYTNPADPAERTMLKDVRLDSDTGDDGKATEIIRFELSSPLPKAHILSWYIYDYQLLPTE
jgi:hypothetical protein